MKTFVFFRRTRQESVDGLEEATNSQNDTLDAGSQSSKATPRKDQEAELSPQTPNKKAIHKLLKPNKKQKETILPATKLIETDDSTPKSKRRKLSHERQSCQSSGSDSLPAMKVKKKKKEKNINLEQSETDAPSAKPSVPKSWTELNWSSNTSNLSDSNLSLLKSEHFHSKKTKLKSNGNVNESESSLQLSHSDQSQKSRKRKHKSLDGAQSESSLSLPNSQIHKKKKKKHELLHVDSISESSLCLESSQQVSPTINLKKKRKSQDYTNQSHDQFASSQYLTPITKKSKKDKKKSESAEIVPTFAQSTEGSSDSKLSKLIAKKKQKSLNVETSDTLNSSEYISLNVRQSQSEKKLHKKKHKHKFSV